MNNQFGILSDPEISYKQYQELEEKYEKALSIIKDLKEAESIREYIYEYQPEFTGYPLILLKAIFKKEIKNINRLSLKRKESLEKVMNCELAKLWSEF